jgi:hypothetical protein
MQIEEDSIAPEPEESLEETDSFQEKKKNSPKQKKNDKQQQRTEGMFYCSLLLESEFIV